MTPGAQGDPRPVGLSTEDRDGTAAPRPCQRFPGSDAWRLAFSGYSINTPPLLLTLLLLSAVKYSS